MSAIDLGRIDWTLSRNEDGHRDYKLTHLVETSDVDDGPAIVINTPGLASIGATWAVGNEVDLWAFCHPNWEVTCVVPNEPSNLWKVVIPFSTRPLRRCQDETVENPLNEPPRLWGSFSKYIEKATKNRHGRLIENSSCEKIEGAEVEFDKSRPNVSVEMNTLSLPLGTIAPMIDTVNDAPLWGLQERMIKLSNMIWKRVLYGTCTFYYIIGYEFDIDFNTFDRKAADLGTRIFLGTEEEYDDHKRDPKWYKQLKTLDQAPTRVALDGGGKLWLPEDPDDPAPDIDVEYYDESNFPALGIPTSF